MRNQKDILSNQLSHPHQDDCNTRMDINNVKQNIEQLQTLTMGVIINKKSTTIEAPQQYALKSSSCTCVQNMLKHVTFVIEKLKFCVFLFVLYAPPRPNMPFGQ